MGEFEQHTQIFYFVYISVYQVIFLVVGFFIIRKIVREYRQEYIDRYKVFQLVFIMMFLVFRNTFMLLIKTPNFEFFYISVLAISMFSFYFFENINNACWINVMLHLKALSKPEQMDMALLKKIQSKEKMILFSLATVILVVMLTLLTIIFIGLVNDCRPEDITDRLYTSHKQTCRNLEQASTILIHITFSIGVTAMIMKVFIGYFLLKMMRNRLYVPYKEVRSSVIFTVVATIIFLIYNSILNYGRIFSTFEIMWSHYVTPTGVGLGELTLETTLQFINLVGEIFLM